MSTEILSDSAQPSQPSSAESGAHVPRHLGLALFVIATAQLMIVLDATIVNVALPQIQEALGFSGTSLEWIVTAYALAFGSLLLLGGRLGDIFGRRRIFIVGVLVFSIGSLLGGFATSQEWLLSARVLQGAGGALAAPTALALIATTFPMGAPRNRALGVYAGMSGAGGAIGLLLGGVLTTYVSWRWVFFVNVPIGAMVIGLAPIALATTHKVRSRLDIPGVVTSSAGLALLVYGLTHAAAGEDGVSHWGEATTIGSLVASAALLVSFVFIERHSKHAELPLHLLASRRRSGAYIMMLLLGTSLFSVFFFLTLYIQMVWGYSAIDAGLAWLPFPIVLIAVNIVVARTLVTKIGVRPLLLVGPLLSTIGFAWLSRLSENGSYWADMLAPSLVLSVGMGFLFVPLTLMVVSHVSNHEQGAASGLLNTTQQIGGAIGLAAIGTIAWSSVANSVSSQMTAAAAAAGGASGSAASGAASGSSAGALPPGVLDHALTVGFSAGLLVAAGVALAGFAAALVTTWTPGPVRLASAVHDAEQASCDVALGTCESV